jgi:zinc protease
MSSRLFQLREQSGLFYTINGSLIAGADEQPGMFLVKTIVSLDRLAEAEKIIKQTIDQVADSITEQELEEAKRAVTNSLVNRFTSNRGTAAAFLLLDKYGFNSDFFDKRAEEINKISLADIKGAVKKVLNSKDLLTLRIGRSLDQKEKQA